MDNSITAKYYMAVFRLINASIMFASFYLTVSLAITEERNNVFTSLLLTKLPDSKYSLLCLKVALSLYLLVLSTTCYIYLHRNALKVRLK